MLFVNKTVANVKVIHKQLMPYLLGPLYNLPIRTCKVLEKAGISTIMEINYLDNCEKRRCI